MALGGLRDLSLITTAAGGAPRDQDLRHRVARADAARGGAARAAPRRADLLRAQRGAQHREDRRRAAALVPEATVRIGHGQMRERDLEQLMVDFYHRRFNVLVCTTIIESGIDVPTANTIMINRADRLGLAQLHQLRGRVGRSHHRAYAYLIAPAAQGARARCGQAPRGHRVDGGAGRRLRAGDARSGDPRRRASCSASSRAARLTEVGLSHVPGHARAGRERAQGGTRAGARPAAGGGHRGGAATCRRFCRRTTSRTCTCDCRSTSASPRPTASSASMN